MKPTLRNILLLAAAPAAVVIAITALATNDAPTRQQPNPAEAKAMRTVYHRTVEIEGQSIFYREAGPKDAPTVLLLHGFPTSSHMFRNLIPAL